MSQDLHNLTSSNSFKEVDSTNIHDTSVSSNVELSSHKKNIMNSSLFQSFVDSFKPEEKGKKYSRDSKDLEKSLSNHSDSANDQSELKQKIQPRQVFLIQLGAGIGTGLLVGNGDALAQAGPAGLLIGYILVSSFIYCTMNAISELGISYAHLPGSYNAFAGLLIDRALGFTVSTIYCIQLLCLLPLELTTATMIIKYWTTSINADAFVVIFFLLVVFINFIGVQGYAEFEFVVNSIKVFLILGFIIFGIITDCGGSAGNGHQYIGGKYWRSPYGAFYGKTHMDHFKGICSSFVYAAFAYGGFESSILTAAEQVNPRKSIIKAGKMLLYRIVIIYCVGVLIMGLLVPYNSPKLLGNGISTTSASPLVIAASNVTALPHIFNACILMSVLSVANNALYASSRVLLGICKQHFPNVPYISYVDRRGRPLFGLFVAAAVGCIAFAASSSHEGLVFDWLLSIGGLAALFTYFSMNLSLIRFRKAMKVQGRSLNEMGFISRTGIFGAYYAAVMIALCLVAQFWIALFPIGSGKASVVNFFQNNLAMVVFIVLYCLFKLLTKEWHILIPAEKIDLVTGRTIFDHEVIKQEALEEKEKLKNSSFFIKVMKFWC